MASGSRRSAGKGKAGKGKKSAALKRFKEGKVSTDYSKNPF